MNTTMMITAVGATTAGAGLVVGATASTDWVGIAQAIQALGVLILAVGTAITTVIQVRQKKDAEVTKQEVKEVKVIMQETKAAVDGGMTKLLEAKEAAAAATATLEEQARARADKGIEDAATLREKERAASTGVTSVGIKAGSSDAPLAVEVVGGPAEGKPAIRTKTDPVELAAAAKVAAEAETDNTRPKPK